MVVYIYSGKHMRCFEAQESYLLVFLILLVVVVSVCVCVYLIHNLVNIHVCMCVFCNVPTFFYPFNIVVGQIVSGFVPWIYTHDSSVSKLSALMLHVPVV